MMTILSGVAVPGGFLNPISKTSSIPSDGNNTGVVSGPGITKSIGPEEICTLNSIGIEFKTINYGADIWDVPIQLTAPATMVFICNAAGAQALVAVNNCAIHFSKLNYRNASATGFSGNEPVIRLGAGVGAMPIAGVRFCNPIDFIYFSSVDPGGLQTTTLAFTSDIAKYGEL